eukprot:9475338-Pyramimonas_sp.AAC.2
MFRCRCAARAARSPWVVVVGWLSIRFPWHPASAAVRRLYTVAEGACRQKVLMADQWREGRGHIPADRTN